PISTRPNSFGTCTRPGSARTMSNWRACCAASSSTRTYYETIPSAVQKAAAEIARLKQEIERLSSDARESSDAGAQVAGQVILEAERFRQDLKQIHKHVKGAMRRSAESLASRMAELLSASIGQTVLLPLRNRL